MAGVIAVTTVASVTYLQRREVKAKDTLDSITQLMSEINTDQPYNILEIVPDDVFFSVSMNNSYGEEVTVSGNQSMGFIGYYVGGQEPVRKDIDKLFSDQKITRSVQLIDGMNVNETVWVPSSISDANIRYGLVDRMLDSLSSNGILNNTANGRSPVTAKTENRGGKIKYDVYREIREGEAGIDRETFERDVVNNAAWKMLERGDNANTYIDTAIGTMSLVLSGNYVKTYDRIVSDNQSVDDAAAFLKAYIEEKKDTTLSDNNFTYTSLADPDNEIAVDYTKIVERRGDFEPNLIIPDANMLSTEAVKANVTALFSHIPNATFGYYVDPLSVEKEVTSDDDISLGTPLYSKDGDVFYYRGTFGEVFGLSDNKIDDDDSTSDNNIDNNTDNNTGNSSENSSGDNSDGVPADNEDGNDGENNDNPANEDARIIIRDEKHINESAAAKPYFLGTILLDSNSDELKDEDGNDSLLQDNIKEEEELANTSDVPETLFADPEGQENIDGEGLPADNNDASDDGNGNEELKDGEGSEDVINDDPSEDYDKLYAARFIYTRDNTHDQYYGILGFFGADEETGAQYVLASEDSEYGILVPTFVSEGWNGCISESDTCNRDHFVYEYDSKTKGNFRFDSLTHVFDENYDGANNVESYKAYRLRGAKVYYKLDLSNNEWFKKHVFDRDDSELGLYPVTVNTKKVSDIKESRLFDDNRMLVLMSGDSRYCIGDTFKDYVSDNNISRDVYKNMFKRASSDQMPVIVDYKIITDADERDIKEQKTTEHYFDMYSAVEALMLENLDGYYNNIAGLTLNPDTRFTTDELSDSDELTRNDHHFVNKNIYVYNMKTPKQKTGVRQNFTNPFFFTLKDTGDEIKGFDDEEVNGKELSSGGHEVGGFEEVLADIQNENLYRKTDKSSGSRRELLDESITMATAIRYIVGYTTRRIENVKGTMRILEIEPTANFDLQVDDDGTADVNTYWKNDNIASTTTYRNGTFVTNSGKLYYKNDKTKPLIDQKDARIELTRMSVAEFVGHIEDLNAEYDMIYFGMNTGDNNYGINKEKATQADVDAGRADKRDELIPVYNDVNMRGLVYTGVGDYLYMKGGMLGNKPQDYDGSHIINLQAYDVNNAKYRTRYSGNDINEECLAKILSFIDAGYPVVFDDSFYKSKTSNEVNKARIDSTSYMYALASDEWVREQPNVLRRSNLANNKLFNFYLNLAKPEITTFGLAEQAKTELQYIELSKVDNYYHASFEFEITNKGAASSASTYNVALYIDVNSDGKYSHSQEGIRLTSLVDTNGNSVSGSEDADGNVTYELTTGVRYIAQCQLAASYEGVVPWRLEVTQNDNKLRRTNATGYYKIKKDKYTVIKALQITNNSNTTWNMQTTSTTAGNAFHELIKKENSGYDVQITTMTSNEFRNKVSDRIRNRRVPDEEAINLYYDILDQYDMLIMGFADCYQAPDNENAMLAIKAYIEDGNSCLFSHDCTSYVNYENSAKNGTNNTGFGTFWGYLFNKHIRNLVGMDRYNLMNNPGTEDIPHEYDKMIKPNSGNRYIENRDTATGKAETALSTEVIDGENAGYVPDHGYTYFCMNRNGFCGNYTYSNNNRNTTIPFPGKRNLKKLPESMQTNMRDDDTYEVTKVNNGQITKYPYVLPDRFSVSNTHSQYYQLDFTADDDMDGESDIVVWYCISDSNVKNHDNDGYEMSPNDVRNNYYIYNKGSITYTGVGHYKTLKSDGTPVASQDEIKLFVNTLIACYQSGVHEPALDVVESYYNSEKKVRNIYLSYDQFLKDKGSEVFAENENGAIEKTVDIYYKTEKASLMQNSAFIKHTLSSTLYYEITEDEYNANIADTENFVKMEPGSGEVYYGKKITPTAFKHEDSSGNEVGDISDMDDLEDRVVYKATIPVDQAALADIWGSTSSKNNRRVLVVTKDSTQNMRSSRAKIKSKYSVVPVSLVRAQIFDLD